MGGLIVCTIDNTIRKPTSHRHVTQRDRPLTIFSVYFYFLNYAMGKVRFSDHQTLHYFNRGVNLHGNRGLSLHILSPRKLIHLQFGIYRVGPEYY